MRNRRLHWPAGSDQRGIASAALMVCTVATLAGASGCEAAPPPARQGQSPTSGSGPYPSIGRCSPEVAGQSTTCPGTACGADATGAPDGKGVDLALCGTLDLAFTSGTVIAVVGQPDLEIVIEAPLGGGETRIEASEDGVGYSLVGFAGGAPAGTPQSCLAKVQDDRVLVDLAACNLVSNVGFLRVSHQPPGGPMIDAVEALSFKPRE